MFPTSIQGAPVTYAQPTSIRAAVPYPVTSMRAAPVTTVQSGVQAAPAFTQMDANHDGKISRAEWAQMGTMKYAAPTIQPTSIRAAPRVLPTHAQLLRPNRDNLMHGGTVLEEQEYTREQMIQMGYLTTFDQFFDFMDRNKDGDLTQEEIKAGAARINAMPELKPHEVQSQIEQVLGIKAFGAIAYQGNFQQYMGSAAQGGHGVGYHDQGYLEH